MLDWECLEKKRVVSLKEKLRFGSVKSMLNQTVEWEYYVYIIDTPGIR